MDLSKMKLLEKHEGHIITSGKMAKQKANPYNVYEDTDGNKIVEMFCYGGQSFIFDYDDLEKVSNIRTKSGNKPTWTALSKSTVAGGQRSLSYIGYKPGDKSCVYLHRMLMNAKPGDPEVDHININSMDNRKCNLRFATRSEQASNQRIKARQCTATNVSDEIKQSYVTKRPKYAWWDTNQNCWIIENHPAQQRFPSIFAGVKGSKSNGASQEAKLQEVQYKVNLLDKYMHPDTTQEEKQDIINQIGRKEVRTENKNKKKKLERGVIPDEIYEEFMNMEFVRYSKEKNRGGAFVIQHGRLAATNSKYRTKSSEDRAYKLTKTIATSSSIGVDIMDKWNCIKQIKKRFDDLEQDLRNVSEEKANELIRAFNTDVEDIKAKFRG